MLHKLNKDICPDCKAILSITSDNCQECGHGEFIELSVCCGGKIRYGHCTICGEHSMSIGEKYA